MKSIFLLATTLVAISATAVPPALSQNIVSENPGVYVEHSIHVPLHTFQVKQVSSTSFGLGGFLLDVLIMGGDDALDNALEDFDESQSKIPIVLFSASGQLRSTVLASPLGAL